MNIDYSQFDVGELRGETLADYLIHIETYLVIRDGRRAIYEEPYFPVVELARQLAAWLEEPSRGDFVFDSLSFEEPGAVIVSQTPGGWTFGSRLTPEVTSPEYPWSVVESCGREFVHRVRSELLARGFDVKQIVPGHFT